MHWAILEPTEIGTRIGYCIIAPLRILLDLAQTPFNPEHFESAVGQALERGLVRQRKLLEAIESLNDTPRDIKARDRLLYALLDPKAAPVLIPTAHLTGGIAGGPGSLHGSRDQVA